MYFLYTSHHFIYYFFISYLIYHIFQYFYHLINILSKNYLNSSVFVINLMIINISYKSFHSLLSLINEVYELVIEVIVVDNFSILSVRFSILVFLAFNNLFVFCIC